MQSHWVRPVEIALLLGARWIMVRMAHLPNT